MIPTLEKGKVLIIVGFNRHVNLELALTLAKEKGSFKVISPDRFMQASLSWFSHEPATVIVEGLPKGDFAMRRLKNIVTSDSIVIGLDLREPVKVKTPYLIFCTTDAKELTQGQPDRRFKIFNRDEDVYL